MKMEINLSFLGQHIYTKQRTSIVILNYDLPVQVTVTVCFGRIIFTSYSFISWHRLDEGVFGSFEYFRIQKQLE